MGESSAKQLRGENLADVIFNGSNSRKPSGVASIELLFDNSDQRIGGEYSAYAEISIRRQVTRDSQSSYFLNGTKCRRRDIGDIFLGTGFGPRSYSIIEQGMISQLVEARPEDLRVYLEEAAGISRYKERRRETSNRIKHTLENLERLTDIRDELGRQLDHLKRQAKAAERYRELKVEERKLSAELHTVRYRDLAVELKTQTTAIAELEVELEKSIAGQRALDATIEELRVKHSEGSDAFNREQGRFYELGADVARIEEAIAFNQQRVRQLELDLETVSQRATEADRQLSMDEAQITELNSEIQRLEPDVQQAEATDQAAVQALAESESGHRELQQSWEAFNTRAANNERDAQVQASRIDHLEQLIQRLKTRSDQLEDEVRHTEGERPEAGAVDSLYEEIETRQQSFRAAEAEIDQCLKELAAAREDVLDRERVLEEARSEVQGLRHDLASLEAQQRAALGRSEGDTESWLENQGLSKSVRLGEALAVVPGWERAVEIVLGEFIQGILLEDIAPYVGALDGLKDGHVALVEGSVVAEVNGPLPALVSLIRAEGEDTLNIGSLLHGVFAAESAEVAIANRSDLKPGQSIVTRDGLWVGPDWLRMLPHTESDAGIIQRAQELETLNLRVEGAENTLAEMQRLVTEGRARVESLQTQRENLQTRVNDLNRDLGELKADHGVRRVQLEEADARRQRLVKDKADIRGQIEAELVNLGNARQALIEAETQRETNQAERVQLEQARQSATERLETARERARSTRDQFHALNTELKGYQSRLAASTTARDRLLRQQQELREQQNTLKTGMESSTTPLPQLQQDLEARLAERLQAETQLAQARASLETIDADARRQESSRGEAEAATLDVRSRLEDLRVQRQGLAVQETNLLEQIAATGHELEEVLNALPEDALEATLQEQLERNGRRIQRLGAINLAAIDEYETSSERKKYLDEQHQDLEQALETLQAAIRKIDRETRSRFKETFETVNSHLKELFPKVFGGGHAYLELTGEDLLDTGVSLMARPPGKRNSSVHLLSGGEKAMTAVALIFSIFRLNPSPVCLLDEVDAPLDDANVTRFAELIREMSSEVQFVVITHNKLTMEMADHLMGVTMNEPGVSRLVSVDVEEAAAMAAV
jgi:chromosome segregation protein